MKSNLALTVEGLEAVSFWTFLGHDLSVGWASGHRLHGEDRLQEWNWTNSVFPDDLASLQTRNETPHILFHTACVM